MGKYKDKHNFDADAAALIIHAKASSLHHRAPEIYPEAFLYSLFAVLPNAVSEIILDGDLDLIKSAKKFATKALLKRFLGEEFDGDIMDLDRSSDVEIMFDKAKDFSDQYSNNGIINVFHIFFALLEMVSGFQEFVESHNIDLSLGFDMMGVTSKSKGMPSANAVKNASKNKNKSQKKVKVLEKFCKNFNQMAKSGKIEEVVARDEEINYAITVLCRKNKSNPVLLGEPGVGKTAIVEGIASRIVNGDVPDKIKDCQIYCLSLSTLVAGTKYRGEFEERMQDIISEIEANPSYIIFIDELHNLIGAGSSTSGSMDAANILKPALARDLRCIGATTHDEYKKYIESDGALGRRFEKIIIKEPDDEQVELILNKVKISLEKFHGCKIPKETILSCISYLNKYVVSERFPDKAIDCLDTACALHAWSKAKTPQITSLDIAKVVSNKCGVPVKTIMGTDIDRLEKIDKELKETVFGQDQAIQSVLNIIKRSASGIGDKSRPVGSLVFGGPSGVGKTYLAKRLSISAFEDRNALVRIDMSEYADSSSVSKIIGSPPGYVGHNHSETVADLIRRMPYGVLLLDEVEKAHPQVMRLFLQAMSEGFFTDSLGNKVSCRHMIIIMTGNFNMGSKVEDKKLSGFGGFEDKVVAIDCEKTKEEIIQYCKDEYGEEFVNRIDAFVYFSDLNEETMRKIVESKLDEISERVIHSGIKIKFASSLIDYILKISNSSFGKNAMMVGRVISMEVEPILAGKLLEVNSDGPCTIYMKYNKDKIECNHRCYGKSKNKS